MRRQRPPSLADLLDQVPIGRRKPLAVVLAGHNGSGKTTLWSQRLSGGLRIPLINADRLTESILPARNLRTSRLPLWAEHLRDKNADWQYLSQQGVQAFVSIAMGRKLPFAFETVFSHWRVRPDKTIESKVDLIREMQRKGYFVVLLFVGLQSASMSILRVQSREAKGGHGVPVSKLRTRFPRTQMAIGVAAPIADMTLMFDNSRTEAEAFVLVRAQRKQTVLFDCRDSKYSVNDDLRRIAGRWLRKIVGPWPT